MKKSDKREKDKVNCVYRGLVFVEYKGGGGETHVRGQH